MVTVATACAECPWRTANQGKPHPHGFYTRRNLTRLWNQLRRGGAAQSCHPTDPSHPDHGARPGTTPRECAGSVALILREFAQLASGGEVIGAAQIERYLAVRRKGLTRSGLLYWLIQRYQMGGIPILGQGKLPDVADGPEIGLPSYLEEGDIR